MMDGNQLRRPEIKLDLTLSLPGRKGSMSGPNKKGPSLGFRACLSSIMPINNDDEQTLSATLLCSRP